MFKRWMIVANATSYDDVECRRASEIWMREHVNEPSNRFRTKSAALMEIARNHDRIWGSLLHFRIVKVKDFYEPHRRQASVMSLTTCPDCGKGHVCHVEETDWEQRFTDLRDAVLTLCADPDPDTDDGMTLVSVDAIREVVARVERGES